MAARVIFAGFYASSSKKLALKLSYPNSIATGILRMVQLFVYYIDASLTYGKASLAQILTLLS